MIKNSAEEIALIIKIGTTAMLFAASIVIGIVLYLHKRIMKTQMKE